MSQRGATPLEAEEAEIQAQQAELDARLIVVREARGFISQLRGLLSKHPGLRIKLAAELQLLTESDSPPDGNWIVGTVCRPAPRADVGPVVANVINPPPPLHVRIAEFIEQRGNQPTTIREMAEAASASDATVRKIICERHKGKFRRVIDPHSVVGRWVLALWPPRGDASHDAEADEAEASLLTGEEEMP